jgi:branched-chain amino acid transport system ATP-binding protein
MRLEFHGITAGYGASTVLRDVTLTVPKGRTVALLGANGAGKTTLLGTASGLVSVRAGHITLDGHDTTGWSIDRRVNAGLCHITETDAIFPGLSVADNLRVFTPRRTDGTGVDRAIDAFPKLGHRLTQTAGTLSGGEQRMLALARVYAAAATTVLLDEVSLGLAPIVVDEIFTFLARLASEGVSLLIVEQYVTKVLAMADFVYVLARGRIAFAGETHELDNQQLAAQYLGETAHARA